MTIPDIKLNTGATIPSIGFGTWRLANGSESHDAVVWALKTGYRLIDTAKIYGNEAAVGSAINNSGIQRQQIFVTSKLWNSDQGYDSALIAFNDSLARLGLDYLDLYLIHWPGRSAHKRQESWKALQQIHKSGRAKAIGVSNFSVDNLQELIKLSGTVPMVNQIEFNPFIYKAQEPILEFCRQKGIVIEAYSPLARGHQMDNSVIAGVAKKLNRSNAQIMLRWAYQHGTIPIPKSTHHDRIIQNYDIFDFELTVKEVQSINDLSNSKSSLPFLVRLLK